MGSFSPQVQAPQSVSQQPAFNGIPDPQKQQTQEDELQKALQGLMGGNVTTPSQGGQPEFGVPSAYQNTMQPYNQQQPQPTNGKGNLFNNQSVQKAIGKGV